MHLAKWMAALEQVIVRHLTTCAKFLIFVNSTWPSAIEWPSGSPYCSILRYKVILLVFSGRVMLRPINAKTK